MVTRYICLLHFIKANFFSQCKSLLLQFFYFFTQVKASKIMNKVRKQFFSYPVHAGFRHTSSDFGCDVNGMLHVVASV
jgi:hypothetical protein